VDKTQKNEERNVYVEPIIDSQNPPISIDNVMLGDPGTGVLRLIGFSGNAFAVKKEEKSTPEEEFLRVWARPVCVLDLSPRALKVVERYLLSSLAEHPEDLKQTVREFPDLTKKLRACLKTLDETLEEEDNDVNIARQ